MVGRNSSEWLIAVERGGPAPRWTSVLEAGAGSLSEERVGHVSPSGRGPLVGCDGTPCRPPIGVPVTALIASTKPDLSDSRS
ncbi:hypothetical protein TL08_09220 [Actinoalloteichus hymeniacidonis]|uniref:Uncharacterized protein n=1 Tax=Actinoalloteichus hymeniacidonis TaxID=340345 RepID=A0AAC9HNM0_9PSEU|nr:hypothetical protein TL08_09220 [Actinoalloteichus hymeniacidonis]